MRFFSSMGSLMFTLVIIIFIGKISLAIVQLISLKLNKLFQKLFSKFRKKTSIEDGIDKPFKSIDNIYTTLEFYDSYGSEEHYEKEDKHS